MYDIRFINYSCRTMEQTMNRIEKIRQKLKILRSKVLRKKVAYILVVAMLTLGVAGFLFFHLSSDYNIYIARSGSMSPAINQGDMVFTGPVNGPFSGDIKMGTIVTYERDESAITHRVIGFDGDMLVTKGDASEDADMWPVPISNVKGVYLFRLPYLGYVSNFFRSEIGFIVLIIPVVLLIAFIIRDMVKQVRKPVEIEKNTKDEEVAEKRIMKLNT